MDAAARGGLDGLEWSYGWSAPAAQRLRFVLDFGYATGLRVSELVRAALGDIRRDEGGECWLQVVGKGSKWTKVAMPPLARGAELTAVRDNLRHASIATTSMYLHGNDLQRARQMNQAFSARK